MVSAVGLRIHSGMYPTGYLPPTYYRMYHILLSMYQSRDPILAENLLHTAGTGLASVYDMQWELYSFSPPPRSASWFYAGVCHRVWPQVLTYSRQL